MTANYIAATVSLMIIAALLPVLTSSRAWVGWAALIGIALNTILFVAEVIVIARHG